MQISAGRPIPVLPQHTFPGNVILSSTATSGLSPPVVLDPELEKLSLGHLTAAAKNAITLLTDAPSSSVPEAQQPADGDGDSSETFSGASLCKA